jgi:hypothetical protein
MNSFRIASLLTALALAGCAGSGKEIVVRGGGGRGRTFDFDPSQGELIAWGPRGKLLQLWLRPGELMVVGLATRRTVDAECRGGFLRAVGQDGAPILVEIHLCPRTDAPAGWKGWHADFEVHTESVAPGTLPPVVDFGIAWADDLRTLRVASRTSRGTVTVPDRAAVVRSPPELFALAIVMGIVPPSPDGTYVVE